MIAGIINHVILRAPSAWMQQIFWNHQAVSGWRWPGYAGGIMSAALDGIATASDGERRRASSV
jgi:hypothetical protein